MCWLRGRRERGFAWSAGVRSRMLRIPKHSAFTQWYRTVAAPCPPRLTPAATGAAGLRPCLLHRMLRASKHSSKAAGRPGKSPLPAVFLKRCSGQLILMVKKYSSSSADSRVPLTQAVQKISAYKYMQHLGLVWPA